MIEINLLPEEVRKKKHVVVKAESSAMPATSLPLINVVMWIVGVVLIMQSVLFVIGLINGTALKSMDGEYKNMLPKKQETEMLKVRVGDTSKKVAAIDELMVKRFSWEKKLNSLSDAMTPGIWLTELEYDEKLISPPASNADAAKKKNKAAEESVLDRKLVLNGAASSMGEEGTALIGRFIKNLKDDPVFYSDFRDIELGNIKREKVEDQEIMTFKITCYFKAK